MPGPMPPYLGKQPGYYNQRGGGDPNPGRMWGPQMGIANGPPQMGPPNRPGYPNMYNMTPNIQQSGIPPSQHHMDNSFSGDMNQYPGHGPGMGPPQGPGPGMSSNQGNQPLGGPPVMQPGSGPCGPGSGGYMPTPGSQGPRDPMGSPDMPQQGPGPPTGMMSQGPGPPPAYNQNMNVPFNADQSGNPSGMRNQTGGMPGSAQQMYQQQGEISTGPMHPHLRNHPQNPQQVADSILQMASSSYTSPSNNMGPGPPPVNRYRHPMTQQQGQQGPMHNGQMMQQMSPNQFGAGPRMQQPMSHFTCPNTSPMPPQSSASPISPMQPVQSPASMHSNASMPSTSPGPMRSPVPPSMPPNPSPGLGNMRSPAGTMHPQGMGNTQQQGPPMRSPVHTPHSMAPSMSPLNPGSQGQPSPASGPSMCSPSHQMAVPASFPMYTPDSTSYQMNSHATMSTTSGQSSPSTFSTCSQPSVSGNMMQHHTVGPGPSPGAPPHSHPAQQHQSMGGGSGAPGHRMEDQGSQMYQQQQQQQQNMNCQNTTNSNTFANTPSSSNVFTTQSPPTYTSNTAPVQQQAHPPPPPNTGSVNPLQSLQKLVMLPESQVVDPKSVVNDACLPSASEDMPNKLEEEIGSKNLIDEFRSTPRPVAPPTSPTWARHRITYKASMFNKTNSNFLPHRKQVIVQHTVAQSRTWKMN